MAKAISTCVSDFFIFVVRLCIFLLFGNPLFMFFYHLQFPHRAAEFAKNRNIFGEKIYAFYEHLALKWPFHWAKWWMTLNNLPNYTVKQQIQYLFKVAFRNGTEIETLKMMGVKEFWPDVYEELFFKYGRQVLPLKRCDIHNRDTTPKWYLRYVAEFMAQNVRLSYKALEKLICWAAKDVQVRTTLQNYLASGKLNDDQFKLLINAVTTELSYTDSNMLGVLLDYVKRYGVSAEMLKYEFCFYPLETFELVKDAEVWYEQMKALKAFKNTPEGRTAWGKFCQETFELLPEVQCQMSPIQYDIFHKNGQKLCFKAIEAFLYKKDKALWYSVFEYEEDSCQMKAIRDFISRIPDLEAEFKNYKFMQENPSLKSAFDKAQKLAKTEEVTEA